MRIRFVATVLAASVLAAGAAGCSPRSEPVHQKTARVTINGHTRTSHAVSCSQVQWLLTADIGAAPAHIQAVIDLGQDPKPESVHIDNFEGFTGVADTGGGKTKAVFSKDTYTITGTAQGTDPDNPNTPATADFKIEVSC
ncbi:hypothetical protein A5707_07930 [Mycobacterium kyorinense]|uniref:Lipoprotein LppE n=1 Tax=Mycobacterium kyorinense TaxID=487514 RepID=A0A1A2YW05_9MYCO|nr:hypothetical protein A5707_07930 [Mycobacterium kyorinense]